MSNKEYKQKSTVYPFGVSVCRYENHLSYMAIFAFRKQTILKKTYPEETAAALAADMVKIAIKVFLRRRQTLQY